MSSFVKASVLGLGLLTGVAFAAQAQDTASLPPNAGAPSAVSAVWGALAIWWAVSQSPVWLIAVPVQLGGAVMYARRRLPLAVRAGRGLRAAALAGLYPRVATRSLGNGKIAITIDTQATDQATHDALRRIFSAPEVLGPPRPVPQDRRATDPPPRH